MVQGSTAGGVAAEARWAPLTISGRCGSGRTWRKRCSLAELLSDTASSSLYASSQACRYPGPHQQQGNLIVHSHSFIPICGFKHTQIWHYPYQSAFLHRS